MDGDSEVVTNTSWENRSMFSSLYPRARREWIVFLYAQIFEKAYRAKGGRHSSEEPPEFDAWVRGQSSGSETNTPSTTPAASRNSTPSDTLGEQQQTTSGAIKTVK